MSIYLRVKELNNKTPNIRVNFSYLKDVILNTTNRSQIIFKVNLISICKNKLIVFELEKLI
jgi:hypothetical protein